MCGICGFTGVANSVTLKKMTDSIEHRGPDEEGFYSDGFVNLGVRRLSIIDVATGHQPVHNEESTVWAVFNGEVYNFQSLRNELSARGHKFYTDHSDTEVIVHLYEEYGDAFPNMMNGMFAVALWDTKEKKLLLVRDRMGVKPLFFTVRGETIIFASEIKAILTHPDCSKEPDWEGLYHYFTLKCVPAPLTAFRGISALCSGEMLLFQNGKIRKQRWWKVRFGEREDYEEGALAEKIRDLIADATRLRMISDVPIGAYLSGGVDSSLVR